MEDFSRTLNLVSTEEIPEGVWNAIENSLGSKEGVSYKRNSQNSFSIKFPSYQYSSEYILDIVKKTGFKERKKEKKSLWRRWIDSIASDTDSSLGSRRLDCCSLNRLNQNQAGRRPKYHQ